MMILNIIPAPNPRRAVWYDPSTNDLVFATSDIIGLIELENPDNEIEIATVPMYMTSDHFGVYTIPQLDINFLDFIAFNESVDLGKYTKQIEEIKSLYNQSKGEEVVEVETTGNVSKIKRIIKNSKTEGPKE